MRRVWRVERNFGGQFRGDEAELRGGLPSLLQAQRSRNNLGHFSRRIYDPRGTGVTPGHAPAAELRT